MPKHSFDAHEIHNVDVDFVALVKRGANRIPFRITKEDTEPMLDLNKAFGSMFRKAEQKPGVLHAVIRKGADLEALKAVLVDAGLSVDKASEQEGGTVFTQAGVDDFDTGVLKINDDIGLVVSGLTKSFDGYASSNEGFSDVLKTNGFYPSIRMATEAFTDAVYGVMYKADSPTEAATLLSGMADDFRSYLATLAGALPVHAFKTESGIVELMKKDGKTPAETDDEKKARLAKEAAAKAVTKADDKKDEPPAPAEKTPEEIAADAAVRQSDKDKADKEPVEKADTNDMAAQLAALTKTVTEAITALSGKVDQTTEMVKTETSKVTDQVEILAGRVKKSEEALHGTVSASPEVDRLGLRKTDNAPRAAPPLLDTAIMKADAA